MSENILQAQYTQRKQKILFGGKYNLCSIGYVMEIDPSYLVWMHEKTDHKLSARLYREALESAEALEETKYDDFLPL